MAAIPTLRTVTLNTRFHHTTAPPVRSFPVICPNSTSLLHHTVVPLWTVEFKPSHAPAFTTIKATRPAPLITILITTTLPTHLSQTQRRAITPSRLPVPPAGMSIGIRTLLCLSREHRGLYLLISDSHRLQLSGTTHTTTTAASRDK